MTRRGSEAGCTSLEPTRLGGVWRLIDPDVQHRKSADLQPELTSSIVRPSTGAANC